MKFRFLPKGVAVFFLATALLISYQTATAQLCGYYYRKNITINGSRIVGGPHANFPVLISHTDPDLVASAGKVTNANGYDIAFASNTGTLLPFQLESYNSTTGKIVAWVNVGTVTNGTNVTIQMYYGNAAITTNQSNTSTWSAGYRGVWHFNGNVNDASANNYTSVNNGTTDQASGKIGNARNFNGNWVELTNFPDLNSNFTITGWINSSNVAQDGQRVFVDDVGNTGGYGFSLADEGTSGRMRFYSRNSNPVSLDAATTPASVLLSNNTWYHVAAVADISGAVKRIYINGVQRATGAYTNAWGTDTGNASIGGETASGETANRFNGMLDEIRVSSNALSANWIATEYNSQNQPTTTVGVVTANDFYFVNTTETFYGNPADFGSNLWNVYAYSGNNFENYYGYYVHNSLNFDSQTIWNQNASPSSAAGYMGCTVPNDNHSYRYKRRGFSCGYYQFDIPNHDDNVVIYVNGAEVFRQDSWYNNIAKTNVWQGYLDTNSEIEYTIREFGGGSNAGLTVVYLHPGNASQAVWNGETSTDWTTAGNWCGNFPASGIDVSIPSGTPNSPTISASAQAKDLTISSGATLSMGATGALTSYGNWTNNGTFTATAGSTVVFSGSNANTLSGTSSTTFANVTMNNSNATALTLSTSISINGTFTFTNGDVFPGANMVIFNDGATATGMSNTSYVSGQVRKIGNEVFTFPVGKNGYYAPISISAPGNAAYYFTAEYFNADPNSAGYPVTSLGTGINHVSRCEYWTLSRNPNPSSNVQVTLSWDTPRSCGVDQLTALRIAGWNSTWSNIGNTEFGNNTSGTIRTGNINVSTYAAFTLASSNTNNPLPIELLEFNARFADPHIAIQWKTATETNNDYFTLEKSRNGYAWTVLDTIDGAGNSTLPLSYAYNDLNPRSGLQYYRLTQTDFDGTFKTSNVVSVNVEADLIEDIILYPNPTTGDVNVGIRLDDKSYLIKLSDSNGRLIKEFVLENTNKTTLPVAGLPRGIYFVEVLSSQGTSRSKLVLH